MTFRELREKSGLNQTELADRAGVKQTTISQLDRGSVRDPRWSTIESLSKALGVSPATLAKAIAKTKAAA